MEDYNKKNIKEFKEFTLTIWWGNFGKRTQSFDGTILEYFEKNKVKYSIKTIKENESFERLKFKCSFSIGSMLFKFDGYDLRDMARMVLIIHMSYMGAKAKYILDNRECTINFHR